MKNSSILKGASTIPYKFVHYLKAYLQDIVILKIIFLQVKILPVKVYYYLDVFLLYL